MGEAFFCAYREGHLELVKYYLENNIDVTTIDKGLFLACKKTHLNLVKFLVLWLHSHKQNDV
jgi:hypothetical protein